MVTKIGQISQELTRLNPWWRYQGWQQTDPDLQRARASGIDYRPRCLANLVPGSLYLLRGPRRVGKTVSVKQAIDDLLATGVPPLTVVRVAADGWEASDIRTVVSNAALPPIQTGQTRWWFIDEITAVSGDWAVQVKWLRDNDPDFATATVVLTGSSADALTAAAGVLAGRRGTAADVDRTLLPMGFRSFAEVLTPGVASVTRIAVTDIHTSVGRTAYEHALVWLDDLVRLWEIYLLYGGFPPAVAAAKAAQPVPTWFINDIFNVIHEDAFASGSLSEAQTTALVDRLWLSIGSPANMNTIARDLGLSHDVVARHIAYLRNSYLLWACPQKADTRWLPRDRAQDKLYAIDPLVARLGHLRSAHRADIDTTILAEMQTGMAVRRAIAGSGRPWSAEETLFYVRTPTRKEVDFVSEAFAGGAVEGKYVESGKWKREAATVQATSYAGVLTTRNVLDCSAPGDGPWAVPAAILAALVDS